MNLRKRLFLFYGLVLSMVLGSTTAAMAVGVESTQTTAAFSQMTDDIVATVGPIGIAAVGIAVILLAWRYGRKIFGTVAK